MMLRNVEGPGKHGRSEFRASFTQNLSLLQWTEYLEVLAHYHTTVKPLVLKML